jgi:hypothetical protein
MTAADLLARLGAGLLLPLYVAWHDAPPWAVAACAIGAVGLALAAVPPDDPPPPTATDVGREESL